MSKLTALVQDIVDSAYGDFVHPEVQGYVDIVIAGIAELEAENERLKEQYSDVCDDIEMQNKQMDKIQAFGVRRGMERAAEIAWKLHCSGPPNSIHTAYDASNAIRAELEKTK